MYRMNVVKSRMFLLYVFTMILGSLIVDGCSSVSLFPPSQEDQSSYEYSPTYQQGQQLFEAGQYQKAIAVWETVPPNTPEYRDAQLAIRKARLRIQDLAEGELTSSETATQFDAYVEQAEELERAGQVREALQLYEEARQLYPQNVLLHQKIEEIHLLLDDSVERHKALGELYLSQGAYQQSQKEWEGLLDIDPTNQLAKQRLADLEVLMATNARIFLQRGRSLMNKGLIHGARKEFEKALQVEPNNERPLTYLSSLEQISFTIYTVEKGDTLSSIAAKYTENPSDFRILADFNQLTDYSQLRIGQELKIPHILKFREILSPDEVDILGDINNNNLSGEDTAEARDMPPVPETEMTEELQHVFEQGIVAYNQGNFREALTLFNRVYEQNTNNVDVYDYIVRSIANLQGESETSDDTAVSAPAEDISEKELIGTAEVGSLLDTAETYREAGNLKKSAEAYEQALRLDPENAEIIQKLEESRDDIKKQITVHLNEGIKLFNQEALEEAIQEWDKVLELDPVNQQAASYRAQAEKRLNALKETR